MTSNIKIQRVCEYCSEEFTARKTTTRTCSPTCAKRAYKAAKKAEKIQQATITPGIVGLEQIKAKEFLTVGEVAKLLNCSRKTVYNQITEGTIPAVNMGTRLTRIKRSHLDRLFQEKA